MKRDSYRANVACDQGSVHNWNEQQVQSNPSYDISLMKRFLYTAWMPPNTGVMDSGWGVRWVR